MDNIKEGSLYKTITIDDKEFVIKYGYYDEKEKYSKYNEPIPIFPDFLNYPEYNKEGKPFVTHMQDKCIHYKGNENQETCYSCKYFQTKEDLIGICNCPKNKGGKKL